jgi:hypothetical protein
MAENRLRPQGSSNGLNVADSGTGTGFCLSTSVFPFHNPVELLQTAFTRQKENVPCASLITAYGEAKV